PADLGHVRGHDRLGPGSLPHLQPAAQLDLPLEAPQDLGVLAPELPLDVGLGVDERALFGVHDSPPSPVWHHCNPEGRCPEFVRRRPGWPRPPPTAGSSWSAISSPRATSRPPSASWRPGCCAATSTRSCWASRAAGRPSASPRSWPG